MKLREFLITVSVAFGSAALQLVMKGNSRTNLPNKNHAISREDTLFWSDWTIAATLALTGSVLVSAGQGRSIPIPQVAASYIAIAFGFGVFPYFLRTFAYVPIQLV